MEGRGKRRGGKRRHLYITEGSGEDEVEGAIKRMKIMRISKDKE